VAVDYLMRIFQSR